MSSIIVNISDNNLIDVIKNILDTGMNIKIMDVCNHMKYFIIDTIDIGYENS